MPPEEVAALIAVDFRLENGNLTGCGERIYPVDRPVAAASWYARSQPPGYRSVCGGVVYVEESGTKGKAIPDASPPKIGDRYVWRDSDRPEGIMFAIVLPERHTLAEPDPIPCEAKNFEGRVAVHWRTPPPTSANNFEASWQLRRLNEEVDAEVERINKICFGARRTGQIPKYDVALSYASEDREYVGAVAALLQRNGVSVFDYRDEEEAVRNWGKNLYDCLTDVYSKQARYTVMFISAHYKSKRWADHERQSAQARAFLENREYILPARFDNTEIPGLLPTVNYVSLNQTSPGELAEMIRKKVESFRI